VMPVGEPRKRLRDCNLAMECRQKMKESTQGNDGSKRKSVAACRKVSRCAKVAWQKRKLVRKIWTQGNCGSWKELAVARREMTHHAEVARRRGHNHKRYDQDNVAPRTLKGRKSGMRRWKGPECNSGMRNRGLKQKLQGSKWIKDLGGRLPLCPRNERTSSWRSQSKKPDLTPRKIKDWTLWRGRPPPKWGKKTAQRRGGGNVEALAPTTTERINTTLWGATQD
jgi:hypothetical protein